jgi:hypothetical protein
MSKPHDFKRLTPVLALALAVLFCFQASASDVESRHFALKDESSLRFDIPKTWRSQSQQIEKPAGVQIRVDAPKEAPFLILMTAFQPRSKRKTSFDLKSIRKVVQGAADQLKNKAVETAIPVRALNASHAAGYYISVTDKSPKPGDYKFLNQGLGRIGPLHMSFTILSNDGSGKVMAAAMAMVRSGAFKKSPAKKVQKPKPIAKAHSISVSEREKGFYLTVPVSRLAMTIPGKTLKQDEKGRQAGSTSARYFYLRDDKRQLIISGWFESSRDYRGARLLWMKESAQLRRKNGDKPKHVRFEKLGKWDVVHYQMDTLMGKKLPRAIPNLRAHWVEAGTWIELHLSISADLPPKEAERQLTAALKSIAVAPKN